LGQEALVRAYWRWPLVRRVEQPPGYARKVLVNRYRSLLRPALVEACYAGRVRAAAHALPGHHEGWLVLWAGVRRLPARQRAVIVLRYQEDLPEAEAARLLRVSGSLASQAVPGAGNRAANRRQAVL
jgi:DNA-directed RNA polymerase specialized sigma24 family protein